MAAGVLANPFAQSTVAMRLSGNGTLRLTVCIPPIRSPMGACGRPGRIEAHCGTLAKGKRARGFPLEKNIDRAFLRAIGKHFNVQRHKYK